MSGGKRRQCLKSGHVCPLEKVTAIARFALQKATSLFYFIFRISFYISVGRLVLADRHSSTSIMVVL